MVKKSALGLFILWLDCTQLKWNDCYWVWNEKCDLSILDNLCFYSFRLFVYL